MSVVGRAEIIARLKILYGNNETPFCSVVCSLIILTDPCNLHELFMLKIFDYVNKDRFGFCVVFNFDIIM